MTNQIVRIKRSKKGLKINGIKEKRINKTPLFALAIVLFAILVGCVGGRSHYEEYIPIPDREWNQTNVPFFEFEISDTVQRYDLYFNIRHSRAYEWKNLWVFLSFEVPGGQQETDTLEFILQDAQGRWLGSGSGEIRDGSFLFKTKTRFPRKGKYKASFEQAMRTEVLEDITDIGLKIKKVPG
jgi:gliding motility-associated lipoprotein GldH